MPSFVLGVATEQGPSPLTVPSRTVTCGSEVARSDTRQHGQAADKEENICVFNYFERRLALGCRISPP